MGLAPLIPYIHRILSPLFPDCLWQGRRDRLEIALTFDDGPHPQYTPQLLEVLAQYQVTASFFWLGTRVQTAPAVAQAVYQQGHWLGLHGYTHQSFPCLQPQNLHQGLQRTQSLIAATCGLSPQQIRDVRPPNGVFTPRTLTLLTQWGYRPVMWTVVPVDWSEPDIEIVVKRVLRYIRSGSIVVLHDGPQGGVQVAQSTAQMLPPLLDQGYQFVTIDHLWRQWQLSYKGGPWS